MTNTDKIEIKNLMDGIAKMTDHNKRISAKYVDEKVVKYAKEAKEDYMSNKAYILDIINTNLPLFFDLNHIHYRDWVDIRDGNKIRLRSRCGLELVVKVNDCENLGGYDIKVKDMDLHDVFFYTSDTHDKRYNVCSSYDLVDSISGSATFAYDTQKTPNEWEWLHFYAKNTAEKNKLLVSQFKEALKEILATKKGQADVSEKSIEYVRCVGVYEKVGF